MYEVCLIKLDGIDLFLIRDHFCSKSKYWLNSSKKNLSSRFCSY